MWTIAKLQMMRRLLLQLLTMVEDDLGARGALPEAQRRSLPHW